jgi:hypothetical protein
MMQLATFAINIRKIKRFNYRIMFISGKKKIK